MECWVKNGCQEPPHTWMTSSILLRFLMVIMMVGVISIELDFYWGFQKYVTLVVVVLSEKWLSGTSPYLGEILNQLRFLMMILIVGIIFIELDFAWGFQKYIILRVFSENCCQELPHTWRMSSILLRLLMVILMVVCLFVLIPSPVRVGTLLLEVPGTPNRASIHIFSYDFSKNCCHLDWTWS